MAWMSLMKSPMHEKRLLCCPWVFSYIEWSITKRTTRFINSRTLLMGFNFETPA
jgi:hypothetical protein